MRASTQDYMALLATFFAADARLESSKKIHVEFTDSYGRIYVGITKKMAVIDLDLGKPSQSVEIIFDSFVEVRIETEYRIQRYVPVPEGPKKKIKLKFEVKKMEPIEVIENGLTLRKLQLTLAVLEKERLVLSTDQTDFDRFDKEILGIEICAKT